MNFNVQDPAQDCAKTAEWYRSAANEGNPDAQNSLGEMYCRGEGVRQDFAEAIKWFSKAGSR